MDDFNELLAVANRTALRPPDGLPSRSHQLEVIPAHCRVGCAMLNWTKPKLAESAGLGLSTVADFKRRRSIASAAAVQAIRPRARICWRPRERPELSQANQERTGATGRYRTTEYRCPKRYYDAEVTDRVLVLFDFVWRPLEVGLPTTRPPLYAGSRCWSQWC
jgi:hypothetical protein